MAADGLSSRGARSLFSPHIYFATYMPALSQQYHPTERPDGFFILNVAEQKLNYGPFLAKLNACRGNMPDDTGAYPIDWTGRKELKRGLASYMQRSTGQPVSEQELAIGNGVGTIISTLANILCEERDGFLIPSPMYSAFTNDLGTLHGVVVFPVPLERHNNNIHIQAFQNAKDTFEQIQKQQWTSRAAAASPSSPSPSPSPDDRLSAHVLAANVSYTAPDTPRRIKCVLITNPVNPLGMIYSRSELISLLLWCQSHGLHLIVDEIYLGSCYNINEGTEFVSIIQIANELAKTHTLDLNLIHGLYGISKDFGLSGYRLGWLWSRNPSVHSVLGNLGYFNGVSTDFQLPMAELLKDEAWLSGYLEDNRRILKRSFEALRRVLAGPDDQGGPRIQLVVEPQAGMFAWLDFRPFLLSPTWADEASLFVGLSRHCRVLLTMGSVCFASEPGFFRCCFATVPVEQLVEAMERVNKYVRNVIKTGKY